MTSDDRRPATDPATDPADDTDAWAPAGMPPAPASPRRRGLFVTAIVVFTIGAVFTIIAALTPILLGRDAPTVLYLGAILFTPVGFLLGLLYAILGSRPPKV